MSELDLPCLAPLVAAVHPLAHINALLNALATVLLVLGYWAIKRRREQLHIRMMLAAFAVSIVFLICYLAYHVWPVGAKATPFAGTGSIRAVYYVILVSHILLAMIVPPLAAITIYLGLRDARAKHRRIARWTFPIWLYVSITGVLVYLMLYQLYPPAASEIMWRLPPQREPRTRHQLYPAVASESMWRLPPQREPSAQHQLYPAVASETMWGLPPQREPRAHHQLYPVVASESIMRLDRFGWTGVGTAADVVHAGVRLADGGAV